MKKPIVIKAEMTGWRQMLVFGAVLAALSALIDIQLAINSVITFCLMVPLMFLGKRVVFGQKFLSIRSMFLEEHLINYKNIKAIAEKNESTQGIERPVIVIQLHDDKEISLDITQYNSQDRKRIKELLLHKLDAAEEIYKQKCAASTCRMKLRG